MSTETKIKKWKVYPSRGRKATDRMGRFGGGWQWKLGIQAGTITRMRFTVIVSLFVAEWRIAYDRNGVS